MERLRTYIEGMDERMDGGIPEGHIVLVSGGPGSMKSSLVYSIMYHNALNHKTKSLYITLEQGRESLLVHMKNLGFDVDRVTEYVYIADLSYLRKQIEGRSEGKWLDVFKLYAKNLKKSIDYSILAVDSLPALEILADVKNRRRELFDIFEWIRGLETTTFIITEPYTKGEIFREEEFLADAVIKIEKERRGRNIDRIIYVDKMRATNHTTECFVLTFRDGRFDISLLIED